ncbi:glycan biosynthesis hexose transferase WsfD [Clostridium hydrogenum]|uniref:glycan biosynthesis hexose transferase WsfD n=1 Tax=Clostridium hydrogenum TaxID=2855764 RepID=UPI001F236F08|nr:hypothetical protein [Clostridium hydrogenum]
MKLVLQKLKYIKNNYLIETIILIIIGIILLNTLFIYPVMGRFNNGDFDRLMVYGGLSEIANKYSKIYDNFFHIKYVITDPGVLLPFYWDWVSEAILVKIAVILSLVAHAFTSKVFDIRFLAFIYCAIFLTGNFLILSYKRFSKVTKIVAGAFIILFFTSTCYIAYFNSFYGEAATIVFFFLNIGTYLYLITRDKPKIKDFICFFIASGAFLTAKSQNLPLLVFMLIIYGSLYFFYREANYRKSILIGSIVVVAFCCISYGSLTDTIKENNIFQSVFRGILLNSKHPEKDLQELGIDKKFVAYDGHSFYNKDKGLDPMGKDMLKEFYPKVSNLKILGFYLRHLDVTWERIKDAANNTYAFSDPGKWSFQKGQFDSKKMVNNFRTKLIDKFDNLHKGDYLYKFHDFYKNVYVYIVFSIIYLGISLFYLIKSKERDIKLLNLMLIFILITGSSQFILPMIGAGHGDFGKHLFLLNLSYDIMLGIAVAWCTQMLSRVFIFLKGLSK